MADGVCVRAILFNPSTFTFIVSAVPYTKPHSRRELLWLSVTIPLMRHESATTSASSVSTTGTKGRSPLRSSPAHDDRHERINGNIKTLLLLI